MRALLQGLVLMSVASVLCFFAAEGIVRLFVDPVDFLRPELLDDPVLRWRVPPHSASHDAWGYRNREVPNRIDVVTVGDSVTYGVGARARRSWPAVLAEVSGRSVYNLALGGYGPVDYRALVEEKALSLDPDAIVVGFYLGNDLMDAFRSVYTMEHWAALRDPGWAGETAGPRAVSEADTRAPVQRHFFAGELRRWAGRNFVLYRMGGLALGDVLRGMVLDRKTPGETNLSLLRRPDGSLWAALHPQYLSESYDLEDPRLREGMRQSLVALGAIADLCGERGVRLLVVLLPTRLRVFAEEAARQPRLQNAELIAQLARDEAAAGDEIAGWLDAHGVAYVDSLSALRSRIQTQGLYGPASDNHPHAGGYRVIGEAVAAALDADAG